MYTDTSYNVNSLGELKDLKKKLDTIYTNLQSKDVFKIEDEFKMRDFFYYLDNNSFVLPHPMVFSFDNIFEVLLTYFDNLPNCQFLGKAYIITYYLDNDTSLDTFYVAESRTVPVDNRRYGIAMMSITTMPCHFKSLLRMIEKQSTSHYIMVIHDRKVNKYYCYETLGKQRPGDTMIIDNANVIFNGEKTIKVEYIFSYGIQRVQTKEWRNFKGNRDSNTTNHQYRELTCFYNCLLFLECLANNREQTKEDVSNALQKLVAKTDMTIDNDKVINIKKLVKFSYEKYDHFGLLELRMLIFMYSNTESNDLALSNYMAEYFWHIHNIMYRVIDAVIRMNNPILSLTYFCNDAQFIKNIINEHEEVLGIEKMSLDSDTNNNEPDFFNIEKMFYENPKLEYLKKYMNNTKMIPLKLKRYVEPKLSKGCNFNRDESFKCTKI
jgi:hypothetical protein